MKKLFIVLIMLAAMSASGQWVQTAGPLGGDVNCISVIGSNIFVGTKNIGAFLSTDNGSSWLEVFTTSQSINSSCVIGTTVFLGCTNGIYVTTDYGTSWESRNNGITNTNVTALKVSGTKVYAGTITGAFVSTNNGLNWEPIGNEISTYYILSFAIKDSIIFAGTMSNGIFRSTNNGSNWVNVNNGVFFSTRIPTVEYFGSTIYAGTYGSGLYSSTNNGEDWSANEFNYTYLNKIVVNGSNIYLGTYGASLYYSSNNGTNWIQANNSLDSWHIFDIAFSGSTIFAGSYLNGVYRSTNNMESWTAVGFNKTKINQLVIDDINIYAATQGSKIYRTSNNGANWNPASNGFIGQYTSAICISNNDMYAGTSIGNLNSSFFLSTDKGNTWQSRGLNGKNILSIVESDNNIFVGISNNGVQLSTNKGIDWSSINSGLTNQFINTMCVSGTNVFAGTQGGGVFKTTNNGSNWEYVSDIYRNVCYSFSSLGSRIVAGSNSGVFLSTNNGNNWSLIGLLDESIRTLALYDSTIIAGTNHGVFCTNNDGLNWIQRNQGLENNYVYSFVVSDGYIFAGTYGNSVWKRPISEVVGIQHINTETPSQYSLSQNYPNPFNPTTNIKFSIVNSGDVKLVVYDVQGREVQTLLNERLQPGTYEAMFDGSMLNSGVYFYKLITNGFTETKKMLMIK